MVGTIGALNQIKLKRLLAYSSINHMGYIIIIFSLSDLNSLTTSFLYFFIYFVNLLTLLLILTYIPHSNNIRLYNFFNISFYSQILSYSLFIILLSFGGFPPTLGFISKWFLLYQVIQENQFLLLIIIVTFSTISLFFYLRLINILIISNSIKFINISLMFYSIPPYFTLLIIGLLIFINISSINYILYYIFI